ncbi:hypothetical protein N7474_006007 [Penicillium riverlandense]|uniref:uncharacterized protein n=1 Tax=Penicillium riverlandense TaxID=1903569 RepID=UPI0025479369|nr:uncharacterized protein N7474_006007 [Penicillium riverlandense]KAJ5820416.1 hypothetical protein N7474_006007 [Penicillium riverlandense]
MSNRLFYFLLLPLVAIAVPSVHNCRCLPNQSCWPSDHEWAALNNTLQGNLVAVRPVAAVCHEGDFDATACSAVQAQWANSTWRASEPGAVQWENWEAWPERDQSCYDTTPQNEECGQGRISLYSAIVQTTNQIQRAVQFASRHNLRLAIKNSGHDFLGRSTAPESLQILTFNMKDIQMVDNFVPKGAPKNKGEGQAVTMAAGVNLPELYAFVAQHNRTAIGGSAHTVGAAGGYIQGGGHSPFGAWKGMASDNALEFEVVTASGDLVTANDFQNSDLFWALRGGGGGTFGVVTSVTVRTFPEVPVVASNLNISTAIGDPNFWEAFSQYHAALPALNGAGGSGYYFTLPNYPVSADMSLSAMMILLLFPEHSNASEIDQLYAPLRSKLEQIPGVMTQYETEVFPSIYSTISTLLLGGSQSDSTGGISMLGSRLYSRELLESADGPDRLTDAWRSIKMGPYDQITSHVVAGGAAASNGDKIDSALNPAWRKTITHMLFSRSWSVNATLAQQTAVIKNMTDVEIPILRSVEGEDNMGAYLNEANAYEPGFQASFWGEHYPRLYYLKQKWDPAGLFISRKGVGSEDWDDAGLCRTGGKRTH